jgi:hypothetical protein
LEYGKLKRLAEAAAANRRLAAPPTAFLELMSPSATGPSECVIELEGPRGKMRIQWRGATGADLRTQPGVVGVGVIQITPQMRILVAIEAVDRRKGIDSLA